MGGVLENVVAVTGGTGFIGSRLVHRLTQSGVAVRALARRPAADLPAPLRGPNVTLVHGGIGSEAAVQRLAEGAEVVYHLAGCAKPWTPDPTEVERVNVLGTRRVLDAARRTGVRRVVHTSTNLVELASDHPERILTGYQRSKVAAEEAVREHVAAGEDTVIVRPARVYGPGPLTGANAVTRIVRQYLAGTFRVRLEDGDVRGSWVHVDDVVSGMLAAAGRGTPGAAYTLTGGNASMREFLDTLADVSGVHRRILALPPGVARLAADAFKTVAIFGIAPPITREWVDLFLLDWPSDPDTAARDLGIEAMSLRDGLTDTVGWLRAGQPLWTHQ